MLIDTHAHLTMSQFGDLEEVLKRAKEAGVEYIINAAFDLESSKKSLELAGRYPNIFACAGIHPHNAGELDESSLSELSALLKNKKTLAVGETGLDFYNNEVPEAVQTKAFVKQIEISRDSGLPLVLHGRSAPDKMLEVLNSEAKGQKAVFHCFSQDSAYAKKVLDLGYYISFTGVITFKNAHSMREVVKTVPLERMMIETDCPYLAPQKFRGQRNEPAYVRYVAEMIAEVKKINKEEVEAKTTETAIEFFGIGKQAVKIL